MDSRERAVLADAWRFIPTGKAGGAGIGTFSRNRIDRMIAFLIGLACIVHGVQALAAAVVPIPAEAEWAPVATIATFVALTAMILGCLFNVLASALSGVFAVVYLAALVVWPFAFTEPALPRAEDLWEFYLIDIAVAAAVVAFKLPVQVVWALAAPLLYGAARVIAAGFDSAAWVPVIFEVSFALLLGGALVAMAWALRSAASNVDAVRTRAVDSYAEAAAADAAENERVAVAALMHDSVLGALLAAERADTPREKSLAVAMAREAMSDLASADSDDGDTVDEDASAATIAQEIERAAGEFGAALEVGREGELDADVSGRVARVLTLAAMQAVANVVKHADGAGLAVTVRGRRAPEAVTIVISDTGPGFDVSRVPQDRLGVRGSIVARVASIGGHAAIRSTNDGTVVTIDWESGDRW